MYILNKRVIIKMCFIFLIERRHTKITFLQNMQKFFKYVINPNNIIICTVNVFLGIFCQKNSGYFLPSMNCGRYTRITNFDNAYKFGL